MRKRSVRFTNEELTLDGARMVFVRVAYKLPLNHGDAGAAQVSYSEYWHGVKPCMAGELPMYARTYKTLSWRFGKTSIANMVFITIFCKSSRKGNWFAARWRISSLL